MNKTVYKLVLAIFFCALPAHMLFAEANKPKTTNNNTINVRAYCFYVPKNVVDDPSIAGPDKLKSARYEKLMDVALGFLEPRKVAAVFKNNVFSIGEKEYNRLFDECQKFITKNKGQMFDLKGTDANYPETLTRFYRISVNNYQELSENDKVRLLDDAQILKDLGLDADDRDGLAEVLSNNPDVINKILKNIGKSNLEQLIQGAKDIAGSSYTKNALMIAIVLALAWFGPAYVATAVDLLYPLVYQALFGIPSKWGLSYWLVYYPGKVHAVNWAYTNSGAIIAALGYLGQGLYNLAGYSKAEVKAGLDKVAAASEKGK